MCTLVNAIVVDHQADIQELVDKQVHVSKWPTKLRCMAIDYKGRLTEEHLIRFKMTATLITKINAHCASGLCRHLM